MKKKRVVKKKRAVGRPSKYKDIYIQQMRDHFDVESGNWVTIENNKGEIKHFFQPVNLPMFVTFAREVGVLTKTLHAWAYDVGPDGELLYPDFHVAYEEAKDHQERILVHNGLNGGYKTSFAIFTAKNILGWRDALSHEHTGEDGGPITVINTAMSMQEAAELYAETLRNSKGAG